MSMLVSSVRRSRPRRPRRLALGARKAVKQRSGGHAHGALREVTLAASRTRREPRRSRRSRSLIGQQRRAAEPLPLSDETRERSCEQSRVVRG